TRRWNFSEPAIGEPQPCRRERADTRDLANVPLNELERRITLDGIGIARGDTLCRVARVGAYQVQTELQVGRRSRHDDCSGVVLLLHPHQMLVEGRRALAGFLEMRTLAEKPHGLLP